MIENAQATGAWSFISLAMSLCRTLGYHRLKSADESEKSLIVAQIRLFWTVFSFESGLSLRLGRSSTIRDNDITTSVEMHEPRFVRVARIQRKTYDQLYSQAALITKQHGRVATAQRLSVELQNLIDEARTDIAVCCSAYWLKLGSSLLNNNRKLPKSLTAVKLTSCELYTFIAILCASRLCLR